MYRLTETGVLKIDENMYIPNEPLNRDWQEYLQWLEEGNTPEPIPGPTDEDIINHNKQERDNLISSTDWMVTRHRDQVDGELPTTISPEQYKAILVWRQALRDMTFELVEPEPTPEPEVPPVPETPDTDTPPEDTRATTFRVEFTKGVIWPPLPDFMEDMFDKYPPDSLTKSTQMEFALNE